MWSLAASAAQAEHSRKREFGKIKAATSCTARERNVSISTWIGFICVVPNAMVLHRRVKGQRRGGEGEERERRGVLKRREGKGTRGEEKETKADERGGGKEESSGEGQE